MIKINHSANSGPYRYIRIAQNGKNASNQNHYLSLSGFEIYGDVVDVVVSYLSIRLRILIGHGFFWVFAYVFFSFNHLWWIQMVLVGFYTFSF